MKKQAMGLAALAAAGLAVTPSKAEISDGVVRIGVLNDTSGVFQDYNGPGSIEAAKMAAEDFAGGGKGIKAAQAAEVVALIEPYFVVPMHYELPGLAIELDPLEKFLKAMGVSKVQESDTLKVTAADMPEQPQVVVLTPQMQI